MTFPMIESPSLNVAVVDDDPSLCRSLGRLLRVSGMQSRSYESAESFLADTDARFDCLLLDIQLGGMSGLELARQLSEAGSRVPFIFVTACDDEEAMASARALGCAGYFSKRTAGATVVEAIRRLA